jgi:hypothetical protein
MACLTPDGMHYTPVRIKKPASQIGEAGFVISSGVQSMFEYGCCYTSWAVWPLDPVG